MGPYPHNATRAVITEANPIGTDGFEFVEFAHPNPAELAALFKQMGFRQVAKHRSKDVAVFRQGDVNYLINAEPDSFAQQFARTHGPCACAMAWRVADAGAALSRSLSLGAEEVSTPSGPMELNIPGIEGIGGSHLYFVDRYGDQGSIYDVDFVWTEEADPHPEDAGLYYLDHLTHNVMRGNMDVWTGFYERLFGFREIRFFDIEGKHSGLFSRALTSPCGKIRIPINESRDDRSQIEEYLHAYGGEGIQHIACGSRDIYATVTQLGGNGLEFMPAPPDTYYQRIDTRLPGHEEPIDQLKALGILIDGEGV
ncbi:MAG: 4-hydroxyphenylpyruvate dioxygenase, partial [Gammaproteobacteria bacterium]|nr:4-hydroxyphenylpyruvate dioxygenase [Gammaproteobacteria bacterium]